MAKHSAPLEAAMDALFERYQNIIEAHLVDLALEITTLLRRAHDLGV